MNNHMTAVVFTVLAILELSCASPRGGKPTDTDLVQNRTRGWTDLFLRYPEYPVRRRVCSYKGDEYPDGAMVDTSEPCLKCRCLGGSLVCYLRVCPALPDPPPPRCVLLLRRGACCSELICEDGGLSTNHISRAEPIGGDLPMETVSYGDGKGCIDNGTLYGSGSAMSTSSLCEYCYCISGEQRCVRPRCVLPLPGCRPRRSPHSCCPVRYDCDHPHHLTTTTRAPAQIKGCDVDGVIYPEGEKVVGATQSPCDNCFCMRGSIRCVPLSCAPPLLGCIPIVLPGKCCASSYNCSQKLAEVKANNEILQVSESSRENIEREVIINERSFPDDTLLSPSQIAALLLNADGRINRRIGPDKKQNVTITDDMVNPTENFTSTSTEASEVLSTDEKKKNRTISTPSTVATTTMNITTENVKSSTVPSLQKTGSLNDSVSGEVTNKVENVTEAVVLKKNSTNESETLNNKTSSLQLKSEANATNKISTTPVIMTTESAVDISKMIINDTVNCTTELSLIDTVANTTESQNNSDTLVTLSNYNDTEGRRPYISGSIDAVGESDDDIIQHSDSDKDTTNDISSVGSQVPSTSLIIPKDDDIFMVNVSTFVRTNTSIVTLRPVAAIPPEIEALLNMSINKNNQKDDYFDYDYKSSLPPSLPNLEIIPFLAIDAVDKVKGQSAYGTAYPQVESKNYITSDSFGPTTYAPHAEDKYLSNPTSYAPKRPNNFNRNPVYKQHINDKFQATTYATIVNDNYENHQYAQDKYDATVYPSLTVEDSQTESPSFSFDVNKMNLFSPPSKTEGGFLPRDPPSINSYYDLGYPTSDDISVTDGSLMVTNHAKTNTDDCVSNGRKYKNGELITESRACVVCFCYYGDIHCQDPECPAIKPGCRRKIEKGSLSCCGVEICNDETTTRPHTSLPLVEKVAKTTKSPISSIDRIDTADPFKDVIRTEPAPNLESLIGDMIPHYVRKTTVSTPTPQEPTVTKIPTYVIPSKNIKSPTTSSTTTTTEPSTIAETTKKIYSPSQDKYIPDTNSKITQQYSTTERNVYRPPTTFPPPETTYSDNDQFSEDEEEDEFSFGNVLKLLLGDSSDVQTKPTTVRTTRRYTTPTTTSSSWRPSTSFSTRLDTTTPALTTIRPTTSTVTYPTSATTAYRNTYKYSFTKPIRTASPVSLFHKNITKLGSSVTRAPLVYPAENRFTKPRRPFNSTPIPLTTQSVKNIAQPLLPSNEQLTSHKRKPILNAPADSSIPFGAGLLKLAGCNIYGRMYRVGKIITELSGPCLECMCTEIGVQCRAISC